ncbi:MAG: N-acetyltransferase [Thiohalobacterales bacterium]
MSRSPATSYHIRPVSDRKQLDEFIAVPWPLYQDDPDWVPPLLFEQRQRLTPKNPFFQHASWQAWTAWSGDRPVGRISAQIDRLFLEQHAAKIGYFGMLEAADSPELVAALLATAESWLREQGMQQVRGPFNLSVNEECGLLVEGFDTPPYIMMGHARPYYERHIEAAGYRPARDLLAYQIAPDFDAPAVMTRLAEKAGRDVTIRPLRRKQLQQELEILRDIFNDAWAGNWGFTPFTEAEFADIGKLLALLVDDDFVQIAEIDERPVAMIVALPNINEVIRDLNGRLLPIGWLKLLWRLKVRYPKTARVPLMGVRKEYQQKRLGPALAFMVIDAVRQGLIRRKIRNVEMSWILEDNSGMRNIIETIGGTASKRYRVYEKPL